MLLHDIISYFTQIIQKRLMICETKKLAGLKIQCVKTKMIDHLILKILRVALNKKPIEIADAQKKRLRSFPECQVDLLKIEENKT